MERDHLDRRISMGEMPLWSWLLALLFLGMLFALLSSSADLLGQAAGVTDYLHEFAHDGRHLLAVPCH